MSNSYSLKTGSTQRLFFRFNPKRDLSTVASVKCSMRLRGGATVFANRAATVADGTYLIDGVSTILAPADGVVFVQLTASDTPSAGTYDLEFPVTYSDANDDVFPSAGYAQAIVAQRIT